MQEFVSTRYSNSNYCLLRLVMKRAESSISLTSEAKMRHVTHNTFTKWQWDYDRELQTIIWLECQSKFDHRKKVITKLNCSVCLKYQGKIKGRKNLSEKWIMGVESLCTSNIRDHTYILQATQTCHSTVEEGAGSEQMFDAMIARALCTLPEDDRMRLRHLLCGHWENFCLRIS